MLRMHIDMMLRDMRKLNIGAANISEPELQESALDFVGRVWETMRPRDNTVVINEHVSELRKADDTTENPPTAAQVVSQLAELSGEISGAFQSLFQADNKDKDDCSTVAPTCTSRSSADGSTENESSSATAVVAMGSLFSYFLQPGQQKQALGPSSAGPDAPDETA